MQPLQNDKYGFLVFRRDTDAVVAHGKDPLEVLTLCPDSNARHPLGAAILDRVTDQILEKLLQMRAVHSQ